MDDFNRQVKNTLIRYIQEFNTKPEYTEIKQFYKDNFDLIKSYIQKGGKSGHKLALEDISNLDSSLEQTISNHRIFLQEINRGIATQELTLNDLR